MSKSQNLLCVDLPKTWKHKSPPRVLPFENYFALILRVCFTDQDFGSEVELASRASNVEPGCLYPSSTLVSDKS